MCYSVISPLLRDGYHNAEYDLRLEVSSWNALELRQGSHSTWKTWKNESTPGNPGNIMEFWKI